MSVRSFPRFEQFERAAREAFEAVPAEYREGVDGLVVSREALPDPAHSDVYILGHCLTESYPSDWSGPETTRSQVVLYWGSFRGVARADEDFDWEEELWETLTHELRHHLEALARDDTLEGVDYAVEETFKRDDGVDFDPWYYQHGEELARGVFQVERSFYLEQVWRPESFERTEWIGFEWHGARYRISRPEELGDVHFVWIEGIDAGAASLELVLVRHRSWWEDVKRLGGTYRPVVLESEATAEPDPAAG